jgi:hypothetical protein
MRSGRAVKKGADQIKRFAGTQKRRKSTMRTRGQDALKQLAADGQNTIELGSGEGRMKEEPNAIRHTSLAQLCTSKKQEERTAGLD